MPIIANIVKPGDVRKETQEVKQKPLVSLKTIHENYLKNQAKIAVDIPKAIEKPKVIDKPKRHHFVKEEDEINIKKTSRYLEDLTNIGDN